jgi:hypothetical protein
MAGGFCMDRNTISCITSVLSNLGCNTGMPVCMLHSALSRTHLQSVIIVVEWQGYGNI